MNDRKFVYPWARPSLTIDSSGGASLGNCYSANYERVTSRRRLSKEQLEGLRSLRLIGWGQEFYIRSQCDGKEEPAGYDEVQCVTVDGSGKPTGEPAINPYSGQPYGSMRHEYFTYDVESRCDSGD